MQRLSLLVLVINQPCTSVVSCVVADSHAQSTQQSACTIVAGPIIHGATKDAHPSELVDKARPASAKPTANIEESLANDDPLGEAAEDDPWGEHAKIEYVGIDDENVFHANLISDAENDHDYIPDTDLENPKIAVGVTF